MDVSWDDRKNKANSKKHGVWFEEALTVFWDPFAKSAADPHPAEDRWITVGQSHTGRLLLVVHFEKSDYKIRIISARELTPKEKRDYEEGL